MSDWLPNSIDVFGKNRELEKFKNDVAGIDVFGEESVFTFTRIIPIPEEFSESKDLEKHNIWLCKNWGTRNDALYPEIFIDDDCLGYGYQTINSPPCPIFNSIIDRYPKLDFHIQVWPECCDEFIFEIKTKSGQITHYIYE
jgi:hypothetical protein